MSWKFFIAVLLWGTGCACIIFWMDIWQASVTIVLIVAAMFIAMDEALGEPNEEQEEERNHYDGQA